MGASAKYTVPSSLRDLLKEPVGSLVSETQLLEMITDGSIIVSVGDHVTYTLLIHNIKPRLCIIDHRSKRKQNTIEIDETLSAYGDTIEKVINPAGIITHELWFLIERIYKEFDDDSLVCIEVEGEEDLAALPAILLAPENVTIIYGLPDRGVVVVPSTEEYKQKVKEILAKM